MGLAYTNIGVFSGVNAGGKRVWDVWVCVDNRDLLGIGPGSHACPQVALIGPRAKRRSFWRPSAKRSAELQQGHHK